MLVVLSAGCLVTPSLVQGHRRLRQDTITLKIEEPDYLLEPGTFPVGEFLGTAARIMRMP